MGIQAVADKAPPESGVVVAGSKGSLLPAALRTLILKIKFVVLAIVSCLKALLDHQAKENLKDRVVQQVRFAKGLWELGQKGELAWQQMGLLVESADGVTRGQIMDDLPGAAGKMDRLLIEAEVRRRFPETILPHDKLKMVSLPILEELLRLAKRPGGVTATDPEAQLLTKLFEELPRSALEALTLERLRALLEQGADLELDQIPLGVWVRFETEDLEKLKTWLEQNKLIQPQQALLQELVKSDQPLPSWSSMELLLKCAAGCQGSSALLSLEQLLKLPSWPQGLRDLTLEWLASTRPVHQKERELFQKMANLPETERQSKAVHWECLLRSIVPIIQENGEENLPPLLYRMQIWLMKQSDEMALVALANLSGWPALMKTFYDLEGRVGGMGPEGLRLLLTHAQELANWSDRHSSLLSFLAQMEPVHLEMVLTRGAFFRNCLERVFVRDLSGDWQTQLTLVRTQHIRQLVALLMRCPDDETRRLICDDNGGYLRRLGGLFCNQNDPWLTRLVELEPEKLEIVLTHESFVSEFLSRGRSSSNLVQLMMELASFLKSLPVFARRSVVEAGGAKLKKLHELQGVSFDWLGRIEPEKLSLLLQHVDEVEQCGWQGVTISDLADLSLDKLEMLFARFGFFKLSIYGQHRSSPGQQIGQLVDYLQRCPDGARELLCQDGGVTLRELDREWVGFRRSETSLLGWEWLSNVPITLLCALTLWQQNAHHQSNEFKRAAGLFLQWPKTTLELFDPSWVTPLFDCNALEKTLRQEDVVALSQLQEQERFELLTLLKQNRERAKIVFERGCSLGLLLRFSHNARRGLLNREISAEVFSSANRELFQDLAQFSNEALQGLDSGRLRQLLIDERIVNPCWHEALDREWYESLLCKRAPLHHDGSPYLDLFSKGTLVPVIQLVRSWYPDDYQTRLAHFSSAEALHHLLVQLMPLRHDLNNESLNKQELVKKLLSLPAEQCRDVTAFEIMTLFDVVRGNITAREMLMGEMGPLSGGNPVSLKRLGQLGSDVIGRSLANAHRYRDGKQFQVADGWQGGHRTWGLIPATAEHLCGAIKLLCQMKCQSFDWLNDQKRDRGWELIDWLDDWTWRYKQDDEHTIALIKQLEGIARGIGGVRYPRGLLHELDPNNVNQV